MLFCCFAVHGSLLGFVSVESLSGTRLTGEVGRMSHLTRAARMLPLPMQTRTRISDAEIPVKVTGNGVLYVVKNGETAASYDLADGEQVFSYMSLNASESLSFVYEPGESDTGCAEIGSAKMKSFAFTVILR